MLSVIWFELKQTLRGFAARPLFVAVTVLTLALGIDAGNRVEHCADGGVAL